MDSVILKDILSSQGSVDRAELECNLGDASFIAQIIEDSKDQLVACSFGGTAKVVARSRVRLCRAKECPGCGGLHLCKNFLYSGACHLLQSRRGCSFNHELHSEYNMEVLRRFSLESLSRTELCLLLLQSNNTLLPQICHDYNNTCGCWVECPRLHVCERHLGSRTCTCTRAHDFSASQPLRLLREKHVPVHLFKVLKSVYANKEALRLADKGKGVNNSEPRASSGVDCEWEWSDINQDATGDAPLDGAACDSDSSSTVSTKQSSHRYGGQKKTRGGKGRRRTRQRDKTPSGAAGVERNDPGCGQDAEIFQRPNTSAENDDGCISDSSSTLSTGQSKNRRGAGSAEDVICMFFIRGYCQHEDSCLTVHDKMPYRWQIKQGAFWISMAENETIEKDYCDPQKTCSATCPSVRFETMKSGRNRVRRLSTLNSVVKPNYSHTTDWLWYWEDDNGQWHQYAQSKHRLIRITSKKIEEMYLKNNKDVMTFTAGSQLHELSFQDMIEKNPTNSSTRRVRRRPRFVSAAEVQNKRKRSANITVLPFYLDKTQVAQKGPNALLAPVAMSNAFLTLGQLQLIPKTSSILGETKSDPFSTLLLSGSQLTTTATTTNALLKYSAAPEANLATSPQVTVATTSEKSQFGPPQKTTTKPVNTVSSTKPTNAQFTLPVTSTSSTATNSVNKFSTTSISQMTPPTSKSQFTFTTQTTSANFESTTPAAATKSTSQFTSASTTGTTLTNECSYATSTCGLKSPEQVLTNMSQSKSPMTTSTWATQFDISHTSVAFGSPEAATELTTETSTSSKYTFPPTSGTNTSNAFSSFSVTTASSNPFSPASSVDRSQMTPTTPASAQSQFTSSTLKSSTNSPSAYSKLSTTTLTTKSQLTHATTAAPTLPTSNFTSSTLTTSGLKSTNPFSIDLTPSKSPPMISQAAKSQFSTTSETNSPNAFSTSSTKSQPATTFAATSSNPFSPTLSADRLRKMTPETAQSQFTSPTLKMPELKPSNQFSTDLTTLKFEATTATSQFTANSPNTFSISPKPQLKSQTALQSALATTSQLASPTRSLTTTAASSTQPQSMSHFTNSTTSSRRSQTSSASRPGFALPTHTTTSSTLAGNSPKAFSPTAANSTFPTASTFGCSALPVTRSATSTVTTPPTATKSKDSCTIQ